jgi:hypothetical protein
MKNEHSARVRATLLALGAAGFAACSDSISPVAPTSQPSLAAASANANANANGNGGTSTSTVNHASLHLTQAQFDALRKDWATYKKAVEDGSVKAEALRCEPSQRLTATKRIGAKGGQITLGGHTIDIPAGALASDVDITLEAKPGPFVQLEFAPHGLRFAKPVELTFNYARCVVPADQPLDVVYVAEGFRILETMPTTDRRTVKKMSALTDHFSGYMMSTGRKGADDISDAGVDNGW